MQDEKCCEVYLISYFRFIFLDSISIFVMAVGKYYVGALALSALSAGRKYCQASGGRSC